MKTSQSFGVSFTIKKQKANKEGKTNVFVCIHVNKEKAFLALKQPVSVDDWDYGRGSLKAKASEAKETNAYLEQVKFSITTLYQQLQIAGKEITPQLLKSCFLGEDTDYVLDEILRSPAPAAGSQPTGGS